LPAGTGYTAVTGYVLIPELLGADDARNPALLPIREFIVGQLPSQLSGKIRPPAVGRDEVQRTRRSP